MQRYDKTLIPAAIAAALATAPAAYAETDIGTIVVTPNRTPTEKSKVGSKVETVDEEKIARESKPLVTDYLTLMPGVSVSAPGGAGQETSLSVRGADKKYVKTLFNGIDISDPTATQVQTSWEHLTAGGVSGIEVLKGSQSTLYGSDAVAGVIGISTLGGIDLGLHHDVSIEGGSRGTVRGGYRLRGATETGRFALGLNGLTTDGISRADIRNGNTELDNYRNFTGTFAGEQQLGEAFSVFASGLLIKADGEFDDSGNPPTDNLFNTGNTTQKAGRVGFNFDLFDGRFKNTVSAQIFDVERNLHLVSMWGPFDATYRGLRGKVDYQGAFEATDWATLQFGADSERQSAKVTDNFGTDTSDAFSLTGVWAQALLEPVDNLTLTAGGRHDEHTVFGGYNTWRLTGAYLFPDFGTKLHASVGTGYRAPSLYELYAPFGTGNPALKPEQSFSFDVGVEQTLLDGRLVADLTYFQLDTDNLIDYSYATFSYVQLPGVTRRRGLEASLVWQAAPWLDLEAAYTFTQTRQPDGLQRPRIPAHDIALSATVRPAENWTVTGTARAVLDTTDRISPSFGTFVDVDLDDYVLVDARVAYKWNEDTEFYVRGENLLNQKYQVVKGYGMPGIGVFAGFKARF
ncbi:MAG: TonB-dependent receptor [Rhizobiaceae bacterium]|nr:MAG: TonB-dependent receptor [Rhizobiaceae bacterium]CAG0971882.1 Vitamin B12 transporter BtuB [Rhizobiaceae bacterium]